jgi:PAS domain S-box-containing protein
MFEKHAVEDNLRLATIIRDSNDAVTLLDPNGKIIAWNNGAQKMYGWSEQEALTMNIQDLVPQGVREHTTQTLQSIYKGEDIHSDETQRVTKNGQIIDVLLTVTPLFNKTGQVVSIATTERDISQRKQAENKIRSSEATFRALVESAPDALVIVNTQGKVEVSNSQAEKLFGYSKIELIGMEVEELMPQKYAAKHVISRENYMNYPDMRVVGNGIKPFALNKNGIEIPIEVSLSPIETDHGRVVSAAIRDIRQRQLADEALRSAKNQAETALATKSRFLATASHDLRQPLHSLTLLNRALLKSVDQPEAQRMLAMQGESLAGMARLLNSLLDISKLESGKVEVQKCDFELCPVLEQICAEFEPEAREKGLQLSLDTHRGVRVNSDPVLLTQLLQNILSNAIRYTKNGFVKLSCVADKLHIRIAISDSGIGIPKEQIKNIFNEFHQVNRDPQQRNGGLGLGLSIVQRIAELLGSSVEVVSQTGKGSTFSISLTKSLPKPSVSIDELTNGALAFTQNAVILLIDDDPDVLDATEMLLALEQGFEIVTASSPPEAYEVLKKLIPDLIISDFHLNHRDTGANIIHQAKTTDGHQVPAILVSGDTSPEMDKVNSENIVVMKKPVNPDKLIIQARQLITKLSQE